MTTFANQHSQNNIRDRLMEKEYIASLIIQSVKLDYHFVS